MSAREIFVKTLKFVWIKLAAGVAMVLFALLTLAIFVAIGSIGSGGGIYIAFLIWLILVCGVYAYINRYVLYMVKAGHVAIVATAVTTGSIPDNQVEAAKEMVKERFAASNVYFVLDSLISGAVLQLQRGLQKFDNIFGAIPGVSFLVNVAQQLVRIALGYVDECCLGYTFIHKEQSAFKSAADGVVIYFQNWKVLLKNALLTSLIVVVVSFLAWVIPFALLGGIFSLFGVNWIFSAIVALLVAAVIRSAFIDSYMMVKVMVAYMEVAPSTTISFDLYEKLCGLSSKFKSLWGKAQTEAA